MKKIKPSKKGLVIAAAVALAALAFLILVGAVAADPVVKEVPGPEVTKTVEVEVPGPTKTVEVPADNTVCVQALDAADKMSLAAGDILESSAKVLGEYVPPALTAAFEWDADTLEELAGLIAAETATVNAIDFEALVDDYVAKASECRAGR